MATIDDIGPDIAVLDLETEHSADDCRWCFQPRELHVPGVMVCPLPDRIRTVAETVQAVPPSVYQALGWDRKYALGLSLGAWYSYKRQDVTWFDTLTVDATMQQFVDDQTMLVTFNGAGFDAVLMRGLLRQRADALFRTGDPAAQTEGEHLNALCDAFKTLMLRGYDILEQVWNSDPASKRVRGINSLAALCEANGLPQKAGNSALIPGLWKTGHVATVANHCRDDVLCTKALFETIMREGQLQRLNGSLVNLPRPLRMPPAWWGPILAAAVAPTLAEGMRTAELGSAP